MLNIQNSLKHNLPDIARCHMACFPGSLATKLGQAYVQQTFDWYMDHPARFLFHLQDGDKVVGFCGGFVPARPGDGSSSGMLQHAFNHAIKGLLKKPWLLFHAEVKPHYPFLWRNIKRRLTGKIKPAAPVKAGAPFETYCGLVVIGVLPEYRGKGLAQTLLAEFEKRASGLQQHLLKLSVKKDNRRALKAYQNFGWTIGEEQPLTYVMHKHITA